MWSTKKTAQFVEDWHNMNISKEELTEKYGYKNFAHAKKRIRRLAEIGAFEIDLSARVGKNGKNVDELIVDWNSDMSNVDLAVKHSFPNFVAMRRYATTLRKKGVEVRTRAWDKEEEDQIYRLPLRKEIRESIIRSYSKGCPIRINAQLHDMSERKIKKVISDYRRGKETGDERNRAG